MLIREVEGGEFQLTYENGDTYLGEFDFLNMRMVKVITSQGILNILVTLNAIVWMAKV